MSDDPGARTARPATGAFAVVCAVAWFVAAASARAVGIWLAMGSVSIALALAIFVRDRRAALRLLRPSARLVVAGAAVGWAMAAATYVLYPVLARALPFMRTDLARLYASFRAPPLAIAAVALVPVIAGEELVWRGVVQTELVRRLGAWRGVPLAALAYALAHAPLGSPVLVVAALACGLVWGALRTATASLVPSLLAHVAWDMLVLLWLPLDAR
ncbi:MAG TPA: type II CAAX endopeptidase family protein [Polyangia bacterium]|nr:type II CAAX endopeptidase family protein [Polyangia bacterium]